MFFQVDLVAQGDSVYDIIDASDHFVMRTNLSTSTSLEMGKTHSFDECNPLFPFTYYRLNMIFDNPPLTLSPPQTVSSAAVSTPPSPCGGRVLETSWF